MNKQDLRNIIKLQKEKLKLEEIELFSEKITQQLTQSNYWKEHDVLYSYITFNQEVLTQGIIQTAWDQGKKVAVPKVYERSYMEFCYINSFDDVDSGYCTIQEPLNNNISKEDNVLILMPGLAFDHNKNRIGYGAGYYDSYIAKHKEKNFLKVALCFDFQIVDTVPTDKFDEKVDLIITPTRIIQ